MKLITEIQEHVSPVIVEEKGKKAYYLEGIFLQGDIKNQNNRIYPLSILQKEVARYTKECISESRAMGELGHPLDGPRIHLDRVSHVITHLQQEDRNFIGRAKILDTPNGRIVKSLIDEGVKLGMSSRGLGTITEDRDGNSVVAEDYMLISAADIVADPSAPDAFVRGIMEGKEWVWDNGKLCESDINKIHQQVHAAQSYAKPRKVLAEADAFARFIKGIHINRD